MHGGNSVTLLKTKGQTIMECSAVAALINREGIKQRGPLEIPFLLRVQAGIRFKIDAATYVTLRKHPPLPENGVQILLRWHPMVYIWYRFIIKGIDAFPLSIETQQPETFQYVHLISMTRGKHPTTVGEATVALKHSPVHILREIGRQQGHHAPILSDDYGMVVETVGVIVHIGAVEEKCPVARCPDKGIPFLRIRR